MPCWKNRLRHFETISRPVSRRAAISSLLSVGPVFALGRSCRSSRPTRVSRARILINRVDGRRGAGPLEDAIAMLDRLGLPGFRSFVRE